MGMSGRVSIHFAQRPLLGLSYRKFKSVATVRRSQYENVEKFLWCFLECVLVDHRFSYGERQK